MRALQPVPAQADTSGTAALVEPAVPSPLICSPFGDLRPIRLALALVAGLWLTGCDQLGIESASTIAGRREAEGKAVGGACRHAARSIEACYQLNKRADKAAVFAGWREMEDYMRENKIEAIAAPATTEPVTAKAEDEAPAEEASASKAPS
jgi:hypothetical protein